MVAGYEMYKQNATDKCADCGKVNSKVSNQEWVIDYRHSPNYKPGDTAREYLCLNCGDRIHRINVEEWEEELRKIREKRDLAIRKKSEELPTELRQLWDDLEPKVKDESLGVEDAKRIYALKKKVNEFLTESKSTTIDSEHWTKIKITNELLQNSPAELDNFIKENVSPRTRDIVNKKKNRQIRKCFHENIECCTNDSTFFCCSYCWDAKSPEFLHLLSKWHVSNIDKLLDKHNIHITEFFNNPNYSKLLYENTFTTQEELKSVYQEAEKDLQIFLKKKGIDYNRERERERTNLLQYFLKNNIKSIKLANNKLLIKYNHKEEEEEDPNTPELKQIQDYIQNYSENNSLLLSELQQTNSTTENSKKILYWTLGIGGVFLVGLFIIFARIRKKKKTINAYGQSSKDSKLA